MRVAVGIAVRDITPPAGLALAGFAARTGPALGAHDALTVRALVVGETALVVADVIGVDADLSARIRAGSGLDPDRVVVAASHTHGGPASMPGRLHTAPDPGVLAAIEEGARAALAEARAAARPATLELGVGKDPGRAKNRRAPDGPVDRSLPILTATDDAGRVVAVLASWACHPVVVGAHNRLWTADWMHPLRTLLEEAFPGATALVATGCAGDVNTGHSAAASVSLETPPERTFAAAKAHAAAIADALLAAPRTPVAGSGTAAANGDLLLPLGPAEPVDALLPGWSAAQATADPAKRAALGVWLAWAETTGRRPAAPIPARVTALAWGDARVVALPGEIFAETALELRRSLPPGAFVLSYAEDNPGYICPRPAFDDGGYEVAEAHRYYGQPAAFAPGAAEALTGAARAALATLGPWQRPETLAGPSPA